MAGLFAFNPSAAIPPAPQIHSQLTPKAPAGQSYYPSLPSISGIGGAGTGNPPAQQHYSIPPISSGPVQQSPPQAQQNFSPNAPNTSMENNVSIQCFLLARNLGFSCLCCIIPLLPGSLGPFLSSLRGANHHPSACKTTRFCQCCRPVVY